MRRAIVATALAVAITIILQSAAAFAATPLAGATGTLQPYIDATIAFVKANQQWALPMVFALALAESLAFLSLLVPATVILVAISGLLGGAGVDQKMVVLIWTAATVGGALGYAISYWLGWYFKDDIRKVWPFSARPHMLEAGHRFFEKWGFYGVFAGHFFGPVRAVIPVIAGMCAMSQLPFQIANVFSSGLWAFGVLILPLYGVQFLAG
ncbi:MAG: DedA family protein [Patescibacteria group bacterium]